MILPDTHRALALEVNAPPPRSAFKERIHLIILFIQQSLVTMSDSVRETCAKTKATFCVWYNYLWELVILGHHLPAANRHNMCLLKTMTVALIIALVVGLAVCIAGSTVGHNENMPGITHSKRGIESPSNNELMWNTVTFGVPAFLAFVARM